MPTQQPLPGTAYAAPSYTDTRSVPVFNESGVRVGDLEVIQNSDGTVSIMLAPRDDVKRWVAVVDANEW